MKRFIAFLAILAAVAGWTQAAAAAVMPASTYGVYIEGGSSGNVFTAFPIFDGIAEQGPRAGQMVTINEAEVAFGGGNSRIDVLIDSTGDLFPDFDETAYLGIGVIDPLDFTYAVSLSDVRVTLRNLVGDIVFASGNIVSQASQSSPWDGSFAALLETVGIDQVGGRNVSNIEFNFYVTPFDATAEVPEPGSLLLLGLALLCVSIAQRRRR
jgi:hypothetical protein